MTSDARQLPIDEPQQDERCPLCRGDAITDYHADQLRPYRQCASCQLVFVPVGHFLARADERAHYDLHENDSGDAAYRKFLSRMCDPLVERVPPGGVGLDFGSGPGPTLSVMFQEAGHTVSLFDPYYAGDRSVFDRLYDFITATEVVEHLHDPGRELHRLWNCLKPGGWLGLMTKLVRDRAAFANWHYIRDPTHVCFYSETTMQWLADRWSAELTRVDDDVCLFQKSTVQVVTPRRTAE